MTSNLGPDTAELRRIFALFNGAIADVTETPGTPFPTLDVSGAADLVADMQTVAAKHGLSLSLLWPGHDHDTPFDPQRVNAHLEKTAPGVWRVGRFDIG